MIDTDIMVAVLRFEFPHKSSHHTENRVAGRTLSVPLVWEDLSMKKLLLILVAISASASAQVDLGELSANPYAPESTANPYGPHGSPYSSTSINNPYGESGSPYGSQSARNPYATEAPQLISP